MTAGETINGATLPVAVYQSASDNEVYACDGNDATKVNFIGFAVTNSTDGNPIEVVTSGIIGGFSSLDEGEMYFVQDDKTINKPTGTLPIQVGYAVSATELLIVKGSLFNKGTANRQHVTGTGTQNIAHGLGVIPKFIRIIAVATTTSNTTHTISIGSATGTGNETCVYAYNGTGNGIGNNGSHILFTSSSVGGAAWSATLSAIDKTNITLNFDVAAAGQAVNFIWEAYA